MQKINMCDEASYVLTVEGVTFDHLPPHSC